MFHFVSCKVLNKLPSATIEERIVPPGSASRDSGAAHPHLETGRLDEATVDWSSLGRVKRPHFLAFDNDYPGESGTPRKEEGR